MPLYDVYVTLRTSAIVPIQAKNMHLAKKEIESMEVEDLMICFGIALKQGTKITGVEKIS